MKFFAAVCALALGLVVMEPAASAQSTNTVPIQNTSTTSSSEVNEHGEFGVFLDYFRLQFASLNLYGIGGRGAFNLFHSFALEGDVAYDFQRGVNQTVTGFGGTSTVTTNVHLLNVLVGPKYQIGKGRIRIFATAKAGLLDFGVSSPAVSGSPALNQIANVRNGNKKVVYYGGGGVEFKLWKIPLRIDAGDEVFVDNGANHNIKATAGPVFRF